MQRPSSRCPGPFSLRECIPFRAVPTRYVITALLFFGLAVGASLRVVMSICIGTIAEEGGFDDSISGLVLSAFFFGYMSLQGPSGWLSTKYGGHLLTAVGMLTTCLFSLATPLAANSVTGLVLLRAGAGLGQSTLYPCTHALLSKWAPASERSLLVAIVWAGSLFGTAATLMSASSLLAAAEAAQIELPLSGGDDSVAAASGAGGGGGLFAIRGWRGAFALYSSIGIVWTCLWFALASSEPESNALITREETDFIVSARKSTARDSGGSADELDTEAPMPLPSIAAISAAVAPVHHYASSSQHDGKSAPGGGAFAAVTVSAAPVSSVTPDAGGLVVPWSVLLSTRAVWALFATHATHNWLYYVLLTWGPEFFRRQLHLEWESMATVAALPYVACFVISIAAGVAADFAINSPSLSPLCASCVVPLQACGGRAGFSRRSLVRKGAQALGELIPAAAIVAAGYVSDPSWVIAMVMLAQGFAGISHAGFATNHIDITPQYAGLVFGMSNTLSTLSGIVAPAVVGFIIASDDSEGGDSIGPWRTVFWLTGLICTGGCVVFLVFGQAEPLILPAQLGSEAVAQRGEMGKGAANGSTPPSSPSLSTPPLSSSHSAVHGKSYESAPTPRKSEGARGQ